MTPDGTEQGTSFARRYVAWLSRHAVAGAVLAFVLFAIAVALATRLELHTDLTELLPPDDPAVIELRRLGDVVGTPSTIVVAVEGPDAPANRRFADALAERLRPLIGTKLRALQYRTDASSAFFERNKALYARVEDLVRIRDDFESVLLSKKNPTYFTLDDPVEDLKALKAEVEERGKGENRFPSGYFEGEDGRLLAMIAWTNVSINENVDGYQVHFQVQKLVDELEPSRFGPVKVRLTGDVARNIEEHDSLAHDMKLISVVCSLAVLLVIILFFRNLASIPLLFFPTLLGVAMSFATAALTIGYLNANSAFLGSIILGNGINFGIILLARYYEERRRLVPIDEAVARALERTARPTLVASVASGVAYLCLAAMRFRGFQQFGIIGGVGMVYCWLATFSHGPILILLLERWRRRPPPRPRSARAPLAVARLVLRFPVPVLALAAFTTVLAGMAASGVLADPFDYDMRHMGNTRSAEDGAGALYRRVGGIFPLDITPVGTAVLPDVSFAPSYREALLHKDCVEAEARKGTPAAGLDAECARRVGAGERTGGLIDDVKSVVDLLPSDQERKMEVIREIFHLLDDPSVDKLDADQKKQIDEWRPRRDLRPLRAADLPDLLTLLYRERDGSVGRVVRIFPVQGQFQSWDGRELMRLQDLVHGVALPDGHKVDAVGWTHVFADMLRLLSADGPRVIALSLAGVVILVIVSYRRPRAIGLVLGSLFVGVIWMVGAAAAMGIRFNFLNFVAVPVTLGIGVDYSVNIYQRLGKEPLSAWPRALAETGGAVVLCSSTTIIGYSSLLISDNGALRSLGKVANLGEIACLVAALMMVPAIMVMAERQRRKRAAKAPAEATPKAG
jgi:hypothetical protein